MIRPFTRAAACGSLLVLSACGGGEGDGREEFSLETRGGALRELAMAGSVLAGLPEVREAADASVAKSRGGSWGKVSQRQTSLAQPKAVQNCTLGGTYDRVIDSRSRAFPYFGQPATSVNYTREVDDACFYPSPANELPPGATGTDRFNGTFEKGQTAVLNDGSTLGYAVHGAVGDGTGSSAYFINRTVTQNGRSLYTEIDGLRGTIEQRENQDGSTDQRAIYRYSYSYNGVDGVYSRLVELGKGSTPFIGLSDGDEVKFNGTYAYETSQCVGGQEVLVTTEDPIVLSEGHPVDGRIRLASGGKFALFTFLDDGSATLSLNGKTESVSRNELRNALEDDC